jgi:hypothetical protein
MSRRHRGAGFARSSEPRPKISRNFVGGLRRDQASSAEARCMFDDMSLVTMLCSSTAAAVEVMNSLTLPIAVLIAISELTTSLATLLSAPISPDMVSVACLAWSFVSKATGSKASTCISGPPIRTASLCDSQHKKRRPVRRMDSPQPPHVLRDFRTSVYQAIDD